ncbi:RmlC-like cupin domain-containing protein [Lophiotrema nucula]|uniref:RmlC-like cupin domain-containing protein n=1 Tax=Lophiotrema nucula TaxID=690887 RepID=A0A6A5ZU26_9PLEO|nr:RmlC-like cupin domain-containing protein [Lophiotrema nucula]
MPANRVKPVVLSPATIASARIESFPDPSGGIVTWKTLFSAGKSPTDTLTTGIGTCQAKDGHLKCHRHTQAEIYHVIQGRGIVTIDGEEHGVEKGSVVFIPGDSEHGIRNIGEQDLMWLYVFATDKFEDIVYRFSEEKAPDALRLKPKL